MTIWPHVAMHGNTAVTFVTKFLLNLIEHASAGCEAIHVLHTPCSMCACMVILRKMLRL